MRKQDPLIEAMHFCMDSDTTLDIAREEVINVIDGTIMMYDMGIITEQLVVAANVKLRMALSLLVEAQEVIDKMTNVVMESHALDNLLSNVGVAGRND